jgi:hypothetical protein
MYIIGSLSKGGHEMSIITEEKEKKISSRQIFRLAAVIYADDSPSIDTKEVIKNIVEACIFENSNVDMNIEDILAYCMDQYYINFTYKEIRIILDIYHLDFTSHEYEKCCYYHLTEKRIDEFKKEQKKNIEHYINLFIQQYSPDEEGKIQDAIYKFLYELTTTNINSYRKMLSNGIHSTFFQDSELSVDQTLFSEEEKKYISLFLDWNQDDKNDAITDIILCCLEYCLIISGDTINDLTEAFIKNITVFLDTNIIFRALGINGRSRKEVIVSLLEKCRQGNVNICITSFTEREFFNTIEYSILKISSYARGKITTDLYSWIADYSIYSFYNEWRQTHEGLSFNYFGSYIKSLYKQLLQDFNITESKTPFNPFDDNEKSIIDKYNSEIRNIKKEIVDQNYYYNLDEYYTNSNTHDASLILWIERRREQTFAQVGKGDCFLISSDKSLRHWDLTREKDTLPVVIYPSHFFAILIKTCGRAKNDLKSFVSFINLRPKGSSIQPDKADAILSGISVVTEDISTQKALIQELMEDGFNSILKDNSNEIEIYERTKLFSMRYLENALLKQGQDMALAREQIEAIAETVNQLEVENKINLRTGNLSEKSDKFEQTIREMSTKNTQYKYVWQWWLIPLLFSLYTIATSCFIALQLIFCDAEWNLVPEINNYILTKTIIGKAGDFTLLVLDGVLFSSLAFVFKTYIKNPFDKSKRRKFRNDITQKYIEDNKLLD